MSAKYSRLPLLAAAIALAFAAAPARADDPGPLRPYNAPLSESSVSGISSGAFMAVQFGVAWSSAIKGIGIVAGGPYWCASASPADAFNNYILPVITATGPCMQGPAPDLEPLYLKAIEKAAAGEIDPLANIAAQKIYLFHGYNDAVVDLSVTDAAAAFFRHYLGPAGSGNLFYQSALGAGHSLVVADQPQASGLNACSDNQGPYINQCGYDQAGILLQHIYGALNPPNRDQLTGQVLAFDQSSYTAPHIPGALSMGDTGYVFVPHACAQGAACRIHIALHGCKQDAGDIDRAFVDDTGYNRWADTNDIIVLYPQTTASFFLPSNPEACWDWWSYVSHGDDYVTQSGAQIHAIKAMLDALSAGAKPAAPAPAAPGVAPQALAVIDTSEHAAALAWRAVPGASYYHVWRARPGEAFADIGRVSGPSFGDSGLQPASMHRWRVTAIVNGAESPPSAEAAAATRPEIPPCGNPGSCPLAP